MADPRERYLLEETDHGICLSARHTVTVLDAYAGRAERALEALQDGDQDVLEGVLAGLVSELYGDARLIAAFVASFDRRRALR